MLGCANWWNATPRHADAVRPVSDSPSTHDTPASDCAENESMPAPEQCRLRRGRLGGECSGHNRDPWSLNDAAKIWMTICSCDPWGNTMIKMRNVTIMFAMMGAITSSAHGQITININTNNNRQAISPYVYG